MSKSKKFSRKKNAREVEYVEILQGGDKRLVVQKHKKNRRSPINIHISHLLGKRKILSISYSEYPSGF